MSTAPAAAATDILTIDAGRALDLLCAAVHRHGGRTVGEVHGGIVAAAVRCAPLSDADLTILSRVEIRTLWVRGSLPWPMTLGAVAVFARAQRAQAAGVTWAAALEHAARAAQLLVGLVPLPPLSTHEEKLP